MTIRARLLMLLLPPLILFVVLISLFFFFHWDREITASFRSNLKSIIVTVADLVNPEEIAWINAHRNDPNIIDNPIYQRNFKEFQKLRSKLPVANLFVLNIEPVKIGEKVLADKPFGPSNPIYDGSNPAFAFRQIYLIDTSNRKIYQDYSETGENLVYSTKTPLLTPIYKAMSTHEPLMTGYAPIMNDKGDVIALVGADVNMDLLHRIVQHAILVLFASGLVAVILMIIAAVFIANKIIQPINKLKSAALALAAGEYDEKVNVKGPKEIAELANTFNTMRECLLDHINRLRDSSFLREKLYGEQECALLLQNRMLDGVIAHLEDQRLSIKHLTSAISAPIHGLKLDIVADTTITISLAESMEEGFEGVYALVSGSHNIAGKIIAKFDFASHFITVQNQAMPYPLVWSTQQNKFLPETEGPYPFESGDFVFLFNQELMSIFPHRQTIRDWMGKVMRQFAKENMDLLSVMLNSELNFWIKKSNLSPHIHIFCMKIN